MHTRLQKRHPQVASLRQLPPDAPSGRTHRSRHWQFTPQSTRLRTGSGANTSFSLLGLPVTSADASPLHPRWHTFVPSVLPSFARKRGTPKRSSGPRQHRTIRTVATEILITNAARCRLCKLTRREAALFAGHSPPSIHGTIRYHAQPYGYQPSTLYDISIPWEERVIALVDAFT